MTPGTSSHGTNPLLEGLAPFIPYSRMPYAALREPLAGVEWQGLKPEQREQYLDCCKDHFFPTSFGIDFMMRVQNAIHASLNRRDPRSTDEQKRINQLSLLGVDKWGILPSLANPSTGGILDGWTGMGKSTIVRRALNVIAPNQVIHHSKSDACGWSKLIQITYLYVDFPSNGSRGGLAARILAAIDALIGTSYGEANRRLRNVEESLLLVFKVLLIHRVGLLVLDELQRESFDQSAWYDELVLYLLAMLNLGVPLVLCGPPMAFERLGHKAQVSRRFCEIGYFRLRAAAADHAEWWYNELVPGIMRFNLCEAVRGKEEIVQESRALAAGVPGFFSRMWMEAQRLALRRDGTEAVLTPDDMRQGAHSPEIVSVMKAAQWLEAQSPDDLAYDDLKRGAPSNPVAKVHRAPNRSSGPPTPEDVDAATAQLRKRVENQLRSAERRKKRNEELGTSSEPEDLRVSRPLQLLAGLTEAQSDFFP